MNLRPATAGDVDVLFTWRNDPLTRAASHNNKPLLFSEHVTWLEATLRNPARKLYIAEVDGSPVGTVRADAGLMAELSWTVAPMYRGRGFGTQMLAAALALHPHARAEIKAENAASIRMAEKCGMRLERESGGVLHYLTH
jgi:RimJ/RimL family protein N-acetyltransferase